MEEITIEKRLDDLIKQITERNVKTQDAKESGPWGWIVGVVLALVSLVGIGIAMWLSERRSRELATLKTQVEREKVKQSHRDYEAKREPLINKRNTLLEEVKKQEIIINKQEQEFKALEMSHEERLKKIDGLNAWQKINDI